MAKVRFIYAKQGVSKYISHLDLMRVLRRSFARADIALEHSQGFNPHPYLSVALPLPVGVESRCEVMDVRTVEQPSDAMLRALDRALSPGLTALSYTTELRPVKDIAWARYRLLLDHDGGGVDTGDFLTRGPVVVPRKTKSGVKDIDLVPYLREVVFDCVDGRYGVTALLSAGEPQLNPLLLVAALNQSYPTMGWAEAACERLELRDSALQPWL